MFLNYENIQALFRGFKATFEGALNSGQDVLWPEIAQQVDSNTGAEDYGWIGEAASLREWIGPRQAKSLAAFDYSIKNKDFEGTVVLKKSQIQDNILAGAKAQSGNLGTAARIWPDEILFALLELGEASLCYDGQFFFDTDHPTGIAGTATSNHISHGGALTAHPWYLFDTTKQVKPMIWQLRETPQFVSQTALDSDTVFLNREYLFGVEARGNAGFGLWQCAQKNEGALDSTNVRAGISAMNALTNEVGHSLRINPNIIMVGLSNQFTAVEVVTRIYNDAAFTPNPLQRLRVVVNPLLA